MITYKVTVEDNGTTNWFNEDGSRHRLDGPAVERSNGHKSWWVNGKRHRLDGHAVEYANGYKAWYIEDKQYSETEFLTKIETMNRPCKGKKIVVDGVEYTLS